jgi:hypothetical protein
MRLVALALTLGALTAGCMAQVGDPSTEETQRPDEIVAVSGTARPITTVDLPSAAPPAASGSRAANVAGGGSTLPSGNTMNPGTTTTLADDNPNPSPWDGHNNPGPK